MIGTIVFAVFVLAGFGVWVGEMLASWFSKDDDGVVMEKPEFADTKPEPVRAVVRHGRRPAPLVRVAPYLDDAERTDVIAMEHTKALEKWDLPVPAATYKSHNGWEPEP